MRIATALLFSPTYQTLRYGSAMLLYALIVVLGSIPGARADIGQYASGLWLHSAAYAILTFLIFSGSTGTPARRAVKAVLTIALMGAADELNQSLLTYRHGSVLDWLVDCNAAIVMAMLCWATWPRILRRLRY